MEDILSQHYQNNYRIAYWILKYGWMPSFVLMGGVIAVYAILFRMASSIKNNLGSVLSLTCVMILFLQMLIWGI